METPPEEFEKHMAVACLGCVSGGSADGAFNALVGQGRNSDIGRTAGNRPWIELRRPGPPAKVRSAGLAWVLRAIAIKQGHIAAAVDVAVEDPLNSAATARSLLVSHEMAVRRSKGKFRKGSFFEREEGVQ